MIELEVKSGRIKKAPYGINEVLLLGIVG